SPNVADDEKITALMHAVGIGQRSLVELLLRAKADVNARGPQSSTALSWAAERGNKELTLLLLSHAAARAGGHGAFGSPGAPGHLDLARLLLAHGADARATGGNVLGFLCSPAVQRVDI